jgi:Asp/Glu/hydantoin racemase
VFQVRNHARQRRVLQGMGVEARMVASIALYLDMEVLTDPVAPGARMMAVARESVALGAEAVILGCAGMAHHRRAAEDACGVPMIEPSQAAVVQAILAVVAGRDRRLSEH